MDIAKQVATFVQAKELKKLGITQDSYIFFNSGGLLLENWTVEGNEDSFISAFTSTELGIMLPPYAITKYVDRIEKWYSGCSIKGNEIYEYADTEAEARAALLIRLLSHPKYDYTVQEVNEKLAR